MVRISEDLINVEEAAELLAACREELTLRMEDDLERREQVLRAQMALPAGRARRAGRSEVLRARDALLGRVRMAAQESSDDPNEQHRIDRCEDRSIRPLLSAAVIVVAGVVGGLIILRIDRRRDARARAERARQRAAALTSIDR